MFLLYNALLTLLAPLWVPWMLLRARKRADPPNWTERQGDYAIEMRKDRKRVWVHAVSVGEVVAARPILKELKNELSEHEIVLTVTTSSGHKTAKETASELYDHLFYFPIDVARMQLAAMSRVQPAAVVIMETELWMNFLWAAKVFECRTLLVNGRISDRSFPKARRFRFFYKRLLQNVDRCLMQTQLDADRIQTLGARSAEVFGNSKFDQAAEGLGADPAEWRQKLGIPEGRRVVVVGSTRGEEEEDFVLEALGRLDLQKIAVVHAPRHLERVPDLARKIERKFGAAALRSKQQTGDYLLLDTYGELSNVYAAADVVVIGGGFSNLGGQNLIQALAHGKPVLHGPHMQNFAEVTSAALAAGASQTCATPEELAQGIQSLLDDEARRREMGNAARQLIEQNVGASRRYAEAIAQEARSVKGVGK
jgi:3-deoxy-D-manno-octulosonic-acid transferase